MKSQTQPQGPNRGIQLGTAYLQYLVSLLEKSTFDKYGTRELMNMRSGLQQVDLGGRFGTAYLLAFTLAVDLAILPASCHHPGHHPG